MSSSLAKNTVYMTAASVGQKLIAFVYFLLIARIMMPERTGEFFLVTSIVILFSVTADFGLSSVVIRDIAKATKDKVHYIREAFGLKIFLVFAGVLSLFIASFFLQYTKEITHLIWFGAGILALDALSLFFYSLLRGSQKLIFEATGVLITQSLTSILGIIFLFTAPSVHMLVLALTCGSLLNVLFASIFSVRVYGSQILFPLFHKKAMFRLLKIMTPFAVAGIFIKIYGTLDVILISKLLDPIALGIYSVAYKFTYAFQFIPLAFSAALYPKFSASTTNDPQETVGILMTAIWYIFLVSTPIVFGIWLIAPEMIALTGEAYQESVTLLRALIFVLFPAFLEIPFGSLLNAVEQQKVRMKILGWAVCLNLGIDLLLIPRFGLYGAVVGAMTSYVFIISWEYLSLKLFFPKAQREKLSKNILLILLSGLLMFGVGLLMKPYVHLAVLIVVSGIVYFGGLLRTRIFEITSLIDFFQKQKYRLRIR